MDESITEYEDPIIKGGFSDLKAAILTGRTDIVRTILAAAQSYRDEDELFDADEEGSSGSKKGSEEEGEILDLLQLLLNFKDHDAGTPLHYATKLGRADMVRTLLSAGANPTIKNEDGSTPYDYCKADTVMNAYVGELMQAAAQSKMFRLKQLLSAGVNINSGDGADSDNKVLHWAVSFGSFEMVKLVLDAGANVNSVNGDGASPLHDAAVRGDEDILLELLRRGADISITPFKGPLEGKKAYELCFDKPWLRKVFHKELNLVPLTINGDMESNDYGNSDETSPQGRSLSSEEKGGSYVRKSGKDEEVILLSEDGMKEDFSCTRPTDRTKRTSSSFVLTTPLVAPAQPYFPTITKVDTDVSLLWPQPQKISQYKGAFYVPPISFTVIIISTETFERGAGDLFHTKEVWEMLRPHFTPLGYDFTIEIHTIASEYSFQKGAIYCSVDPLVFSRSEEYKLSFTTDKVNVIARDAAAMYRAVWTFLQCMRIYQGKGIPLWQIHDWPSFSLRGVVLDFYEAFLPKSKILTYFIENMSQFKPTQIYFPVNLFVRFGDQSPLYTRRDLMEILAICSKRRIDVVPFVRIMSSQQRANIINLLQHDVFCLFPMSRYVLFDIKEENSQDDNQSTGEKGSECGFDQWNLILDLHQTCTSSGRAIIIDADVVLRFPQRIPRLPHGLICLVQCQAEGIENYCERLSDLGLPFVVCPQVWTMRASTAHVYSAQTIIKTATKYDPLGVLFKYTIDKKKLASLALATVTLGYSLGHGWKPVHIESTRIPVIVGIINLHVLQDQSDMLGAGLVAILNLSSLDNEKKENCEFDIFRTNLLQDVAENTMETKLSQPHLSCLQQAMTLFKRCITLVKNATLQCSERNFILREIFVLSTVLLFWGRLVKVMVKSSKDGSLSVNNLSAVQRSDMSNKLLNVVDDYKSFYRDNFLQGYGKSPCSFLEDLLRTLHPDSAANLDMEKGIQTV